MSKQDTISPAKKRFPFLPTISFVITYFLIQLYYFDMTLFGFALTLLLSIIGIFYSIKALKLNEQDLASQLMNIDDLTDDELLQLLVTLFRRQGYSVKRPRLSTPHLVIKKRSDKAIVRSVRPDEAVHEEFIHDTVSLKQTFDLMRVIIITTGSFSKKTISCAKANKVNLIDGECLEALLDAHIYEKKSERFINRVRTMFVN